MVGYIGAQLSTGIYVLHLFVSGFFHIAMGFLPQLSVLLQIGPILAFLITALAIWVYHLLIQKLKAR